MDLKYMYSLVGVLQQAGCIVHILKRYLLANVVNSVSGVNMNVKVTSLSRITLTDAHT